MKKIVYVVSLVIQLVAISAANINLPNICNKCDCNTKKEEGVEVICKTDVKDIVFDVNNWYPNKTDDTPNILLTIQYSSIVYLHDTFPDLKITQLNLQHNAINNISDNVFKNLQSMENLILSYNEIEIIHPDAFNGKYLEGDLMPLKSLKLLRLDHNRIHSLNGDVFEHTSRIEELDLAHNPFKKLDIQTVTAITSLAYLKKLDLSYTQLSTLPENFLHTPKQLEYLNLGANSIELIPKTFEDTHALKTLILNRNPIVNITGENKFPRMKNLTILHLCEMQNLTYVGKHAFENLIALEQLFLADNSELTYLADNSICDFEEEGYMNCPPLKELYINDNKLATINHSLLANWNQLKELDLSNNPWTCACENQWFVDELIPIYSNLNEQHAKELKCAAPVEMVDYTFYNLHEKNTHMRCLDAFGNRPERDAAVLVGALAGLLIAIPLVLFIIYAYKMKWFGLVDKSAAAYSRRFYRRTNNNEDLY